MLAIVAARKTLGCGVTNTTNAHNVKSAPMSLIFLCAPTSESNIIAEAVTRTQLAPDTAVMCVNETVFIDATRLSLSLLVSPIAKPGMS